MLNAQQIIKVFEEFFGEENVDTTNDGYITDIIIHFPIVKISNEHDESHVIKELWLKVQLQDVNNSNTVLYGKFLVHRSWHSYKEWTHNYSHSHIPLKCNVNAWLNPCTGEGPINSSIAILSVSGGEEADWMIFCRELQQWTQVESEIGVPYKHLNELDKPIRTSNLIYHPLDFKVYSTYTPSDLSNIIAAECITKGLGKMVICEQNIQFAMDELTLALKINSIIQNYVPLVPEKYTTVYIYNHKLYKSSSTNNMTIPKNYVDGIDDFMFKGKMVKWSVESESTINNDNEVKSIYLYNGLQSVVNQLYQIIKRKFIKYINDHE